MRYRDYQSQVLDTRRYAACTRRPRHPILSYTRLLFLLSPSPAPAVHVAILTIADDALSFDIFSRIDRSGHADGIDRNPFILAGD